MKKKPLHLFLILGVVLVLLSGSLAAVTQIRAQRGLRQCETIATKMKELLPDRTAGVPGGNPAIGMPALPIDDTDYVALLEIPSFDVTVPVADQWNSDRLLASPSRFCGSAYDHTLVIGGADVAYQFAFCDKIENGETVMVTDMTGAQFTYTVQRVDRSKRAESSWLADEAYDLTLFCRDAYTMTYIAVRCAFSAQV